MSKNKKQNDGVRDPSPIKKQALASPSMTQASAAVKSSATALSHSSTAVVAKGTRGPDFAMLHGLRQRVHRLVELKHVLQVGVQEVYLQGLLTVLHVILVLLVNPVLSVIPLLVLLGIYFAALSNDDASVSSSASSFFSGSSSWTYVPCWLMYFSC